LHTFSTSAALKFWTPFVLRSQKLIHSCDSFKLFFVLFPVRKRPPYGYFLLFEACRALGFPYAFAVPLFRPLRILRRLSASFRQRFVRWCLFFFSGMAWTVGETDLSAALATSSSVSPFLFYSFDFESNSRLFLVASRGNPFFPFFARQRLQAPPRWIAFSTDAYTTVGMSTFLALLRTIPTSRTGIDLVIRTAFPLSFPYRSAHWGSFFFPFARLRSRNAFFPGGDPAHSGMNCFVSESGFYHLPSRCSRFELIRFPLPPILSAPAFHNFSPFESIGVVSELVLS